MKSLNLKNLTITTLSLASLVVSFSASADMGKKSNLSVNFNQMIEQSSEERSSLETKMGDHYEQAELNLEEDDTQKVVDFVDVEVQFGKERKLVDRRFNSVGEIRTEAVRNEISRAPNSVVKAFGEVPGAQMQVTLMGKTASN